MIDIFIRVDFNVINCQKVLCRRYYFTFMMTMSCRLVCFIFITHIILSRPRQLFIFIDGKMMMFKLMFSFLHKYNKLSQYVGVISKYKKFWRMFVKIKFQKYERYFQGLNICPTNIEFRNKVTLNRECHGILANNIYHKKKLHNFKL